MSYCADSNLFITAWHIHYPMVDLFQPLWEELASRKQQLNLIKPVFDEIDPISSDDKRKLTAIELKNKYPLRFWVENAGFSASLLTQQMRLWLWS